MLPRTHRRLLDTALDLASPGFASRHADDLRAGSDDEDEYRVPLLGLRLPSLGLSHTCRPGSRYGELGAPSSARRSEMLLGRAVRARRADPRAAARLLGRVCHLLVDASVPARARGIWHLSGDPFELWVEAHLPPVIEPAARPAARTVPGLFEGLATLAARYPAATTSTPWGSLAHRALGRGVTLSQAQIEEQGAVLLPAAAAHLASLFDLVQPALGSENDRPGSRRPG